LIKFGEFWMNARHQNRLKLAHSVIMGH
jgi:hypothetical protein